MTDKCQAPGLECEDCRLKCQLPLIEAEKAQRERLKRMTPYQSWGFCEAINCHAIKHLSARVEMFCQNCKAYQMHQYLKEHGQILEEGSGIQAELNRLQVALEATIKEKERCRLLAVDWALKADGYQMALERCENMKLARELEELLQTTSIPVAVENVRGMIAVKKVAEELVLFNEQIGLDIKDDGADNCARRTYDLLMRKLQALSQVKEVSK